jgi:uncharacterized protein (TIGR03437 family)
VGFIVLKPGDGSGSLTIPVNVNAGTDSSVSVTPGQLSFVYLENGAAPASQNLTVTTTAAASYSVQFISSSGGNWLTVTPWSLAASGGANATLTANVTTSGLAANNYSGQIVLTNNNTGAQRIVPVTLAVGSPVTVSAVPQALTFHAAVGGATTEQTQTVQLTGTGGTATFQASAAGVSGASNFLTVSASTGSTPATLTVGLNSAVVAGLAAGNYSGAVTISSPDIPGGSETVPVTLVVSSTIPQVTTIVSSASLQPGPLSPGEMITIFGSGLAGSAGSSSTSTGGLLPTTLGNAVVNFDGYPAPLIYVSPGQINAIVPYEIAGQTVTKVTVSQDGIPSQALEMRVVATAPAIFSAGQTGNGPGAILNADDRPNGSNHAAATGSVVQIFATGEGLSQDAISGSFTPAQPPFRMPLAAVSMTIGGLPAQVEFAGEAPGLVSGILQINAVIPAGAASGPQPVVLKIGDATNNTQAITVAVQ